MKTILVWDLPLRFFHWGFAVTLTAALVLGLGADEHSALFRWHMLSGLAAGCFLVLRLVLGLVGSRYSRWSAFRLERGRVRAYAAGLFGAAGPRRPGHTPGSALAAIALFLLVPLTIATGAAAGRDPWEDLHGALGFAVLGIVGAHLAGLAWHTIRHRESIAATMVHGRQSVDGDARGLDSAHPVWAAISVVAVVLWLGALVRNHSPEASAIRLPLTGLAVSLGETGHASREHSPHRHSDR